MRLRKAAVFACMAVGLAAADASRMSAPWPVPPSAASAFEDQQQAYPQRLAARRLPNAIRLHKKVISGGLPEGEPAFEELRELGVQTVISVDGAAPDVALARRYGMRYVHLPHGYDGISPSRAQEIAKALRDLPGPIYVHCHHGQHRSPAAAVAGCIAAGLIVADEPASILRFAGTNPHYRGLYETVAAARRIDDQFLDALGADFPETAELPPFQSAMVALDRTHDHLKFIAAAGWQSPAEHPDLDPAHEALLLREHFTELLRTDTVRQFPRRFRQILAQSEADCKVLEQALQDRQDSGVTAPVADRIPAALGRVTANCKSCHEEFRDLPRLPSNGQSPKGRGLKSG